MKVGILTYKARANPENYKPDDRMLSDVLNQEGVEASIFSWSDRSINTRTFDALVLRSCWDSYRNPSPFLAWLDLVEADRPRLINQRDVVIWNYHKERYMSDLITHFQNNPSRSGLIVPSLFYTSQQTILDDEQTFRSAKGMTLFELLGEFDAHVEPMWQGGDIVVKPTISAEGENTFYIRREANNQLADADDILGMPEAETCVERLLQDTTWPGIIIQPALAGIKHGEYSLIYIAGEFSHAVRKITNKNDFKNRVEANRLGIGKCALPSGLLDFADDIMQAVIDQFSLNAITYARVDLILEDDHIPILLELELGDPNLQFVRIPEIFYANRQVPTAIEIEQGRVAQDDALHRFATAIINRTTELAA
ncbi:MAG: hypothetical protein AAF629_23105 [Chloroflexota bacterium]